MATIQYVVNAVDAASATFARIAGSADKLNAELDEIGRKSVAARVGLEGDKEANLALDKLDLKMAKLGKSVAEGKVGVEGQARAMLQIRALELELDKLDRKDVTAHIKVDVDRSGLNRLTGGLIGAGGAGALGSLGAPASGSIGPVLGNPYVLIGAIGAGLAALPFAATAAAGGIVAALGGGLTAVAAIGAAKTRQVQDAFGKMKMTVQAVMGQMGQAIAPAFATVLRTVQSTVAILAGPLTDAIKSIAGPLKTFGTTLAVSLGSPSVARAIRDLGGAFGAILKALAPSIPSIINQIADGIDGIAQAIQAHPKIFADMINFLGHLVGWSLQAIGALTRVANWLVEFTRDVGHWLRVAWDAFTGFFNTVHRSAVAFQDAMVASFRAFWHNVASVFDTIRHGIATVWDTIWRNTVTRVRNGISDVVGFFRGLPGRAIGALEGLGTSLYNFAHMALVKFWNGAKAVGGTIINWFKGLAHSIIGAIKSIFGISSPSSVFYDIGKNLLRGLVNGIKSHYGPTAQAVGNIKYHVGAGVQQWAPLVRRALAMEGLSPSLLSRVLYQMQTESGGNPNAINLTDVNARNGDPSRGLMQVIGNTFRAYHWPGTSWDIFNPLANIAAALNYARHVYGPTLMSGGMGIGSGRGYALGGVITEPIWGIGRSGRSYTFGERGPETVIPGTGRGGTTNITINVAVPPTVNKRAVAREIADVLLEHTKAGGRLYPQGVVPR